LNRPPSDGLFSREFRKSLQYFTLVNPLRYAIDIVHRVYLEGAGLSRLIPDLWPLAVLAAVTLSAASWMFRHRLT